MSNTPRLSKSGIEYLDYAWNFYSGCENWATGVCDGGGQEFNCWARSITERFPDHYPNGFNPTCYPEAFLSPLSLKKPSIIGCAFMGDLFGDWVDPRMLITQSQTQSRFKMPSLHFPLKDYLYEVIKGCPQHTFLFLTKCPWNLPKWSPFPDNCQVGVTITNRLEGLYPMEDISAKIKYISFEPLLHWVVGVDTEFISGLLKAAGISWVIIGAMTCGGADLAKLSYQHPELTPMPYGNRYTLQPKIEWVEEIETSAKKAGIAIFEKDNLKPLLKRELIQEVPK